MDLSSGDTLTVQTEEGGDAFQLVVSNDEEEEGQIQVVYDENGVPQFYAVVSGGSEADAEYSLLPVEETTDVEPHTVIENQEVTMESAVDLEEGGYMLVETNMDEEAIDEVEDEVERQAMAAVSVSLDHAYSLMPYRSGPQLQEKLLQRERLKAQRRLSTGDCQPAKRLRTELEQRPILQNSPQRVAHPESRRVTQPTERSVTLLLPDSPSEAMDSFVILEDENEDGAVSENTYVVQGSSEAEALPFGDDSRIQIISIPEGQGTNSNVVVLPTAEPESDDHDLKLFDPDGNIVTIRPKSGQQVQLLGLTLDSNAIFASDIDSFSDSDYLDPETWTSHLRDCKKVGDYYRGYVCSETELDILLTLHKNATRSSWGTRQSPTPGKSAQRLLWKSQYAPFDGVPFINMGSRAIVMECQFGARRRHAALHAERAGLGIESRKRKQGEIDSNFIECCPARIYIKKVYKFLDYDIGVNDENHVSLRKATKQLMDRYFKDLKARLKNFANSTDTDQPPLRGEDRWYIQLPTKNAHEYHTENNVKESPLQFSQQRSPATYVRKQKASPSPTKSPTPNHLFPTSAVDSIELNPADDEADSMRVPDEEHQRFDVVQKLRECVVFGITNAVEIRKILRTYVESEILPSSGNWQPDRHNRSLYPTVHDIRNHIYQACKDIASGDLECDPDIARFYVDKILSQEPKTFQNGVPYPELTTLDDIVSSFRDAKNFRVLLA